jgi:peptidoglycan/xylan/chitin deacetylase (PgdA/CDA1 family)
MKVLARRFTEQSKPSSRENHLSKSSRIVLTFDDAYANLLDNVLPTLEQYRIPAIIFAVSGNLGKKPNWAIAADHPEANELTMTADQLQALSKHPLIRIGSHTQTHPDLSKLLPERVRQELVDSKRDLEQILSRPVDDLALPHGAFNDTVLQIAREVGFKRIYTLEPRLISNDTLNEGLIGRFSMSPDVWPIEFYLTCVGAYVWLLPWRYVVRRVRVLLRRN